MKEQDSKEKHLVTAIYQLWKIIVFLLFVIAALIYVLVCGVPDLSFTSKEKQLIDYEGTIKKDQPKVSDLWKAPDTSTINNSENFSTIRYGRELIANTSYYLGPNGTVLPNNSNGMNCQNCHLDAGTRPFGNNYGSVASTYPKFRERSGHIESISKRINDCFQRSLNGKILDTAGKEMNAMIAYIKWLGKDIKKKEKVKGSGLMELAYMDRAADPEKGKLVYQAKCESCHQQNGEGKMSEKNFAYQYPPLWGNHSYNTGAGLFRLSRFAGYVKANMPYGTSTYEKPQLTDEEAWDVAAFVNSRSRPGMDIKKDWPKISAKPFDHPFGPYSDEFSETQHKYGPFAPIADAKKKK